jgi:ribosome-associated toxin RatA of RatAB toxin-antitoxin module
MKPVLKKIAKWMLIAVGALVAIVIIVPVFLPKHAHVERSMVINKPPEEVYAVVSDLNQYRSWDPWSDQDSTSKAEVTGSGVGAVYSWKGDATGEGSMTVDSLEPSRSVQVSMRMIKPMEDQFKAGWQLEPSGEGTRITWTFDQDLSYFQRWIGLGMDTLLGPSFDTGLNKLKANLEK